MKEQRFAHEKSIAPKTQANSEWLGQVVQQERFPEPVWGSLARDFEISHSEKFLENSWQKEASIRHWHYDRSRVENHSCHNASSIIPLLMNIVRIFGSLQLSIPLPRNRETDSDEVSFLNELADWQQINSVTFKGAHKCEIYDESHETQTGAMPTYQLSRVKINSAYTRYGTKGGILLDVALGWQSYRSFVIRSLADSAATIRTKSWRPPIEIVYQDELDENLRGIRRISAANAWTRSMLFRNNPSFRR